MNLEDAMIFAVIVTGIILVMYGVANVAVTRRLK